MKQGQQRGSKDGILLADGVFIYRGQLLDRLMLETDAPYLAPVPYRGKRNSSLYLPATAAEIAALRGTTPEEIERITDENATRMFFS